MEKQTSLRPKVAPPSSGGADKAIGALGGGILGASVGIGVWGVILGCLAGFGIGALAEKRERERRTEND